MLDSGKNVDTSVCVGAEVAQTKLRFTMIAQRQTVHESQPVHWKELTRAVKSEDDPARLLQLLHKLNQSLESKARELAEDLLEEVA
jgi:hypothetical protein